MDEYSKNCLQEMLRPDVRLLYTYAADAVNRAFPSVAVAQR